ncbi:MAG: protein kinase [Candidatus Obscuribacterales bacterium]|nr:protein kinase [Candidatus Obscuribacterales bacterium]
MVESCGNYELLGEIGRGGMGIVYRAIHPASNKIVAIKKLFLDQISPEKKEEFKDRFVREAHTIARLKHPNIVEVLDVSLNKDDYFYVMEFLDGESLRKDLLRRGGKMPVENFLPILKQVGEALSFAHSMSIVHRDVKPDNIFILRNGTVKLTDFGIARTADYENANLTKTGIMMGTLAYVSPEQLQDAKGVDHRADIFSLGVVAYEALSGNLPFTADGIAATIVKIISQEEIPLHIACNPPVSIGISNAVSRAMRKRSRERYMTVQEFVKSFESCLTEDEKRDRAELAPPRETSSAGTDLKAMLPGKTQFGATSIDNIVTPTDTEALIAKEADKEDSADKAKVNKQAQEATVIEALPKSEAVGTEEAEKNIVAFKTEIELSPKAGLEAKNGPDAGAKVNPPESRGNSLENSLLSGKTQAEFGQYKQSPPAMFAAVPVPSRLREAESLIYLTSLNNQNAYIALPGKAKPFIEPAVLACHSGRLAIADAGARTINVFSYDGNNFEGTLRWLFEIQHRAAPRPEKSSGFFGFGKAEKAEKEESQDNTRTKFGKITRPGGLAFDSKGRLYVCDASDQYIRIFDSKGFFLSEFKNIQAGDSGITGIAFDTTGLLYLSDSSNACIQIFQPETGVWLRSVSPRSDLNPRRNESKAPPDLRLPAGLAVDRLNQIYLADYGASKIFTFNKQGQLIKHFGKKGSADGDLNIPRAVAVDKFDRIYVCDSFNNRLAVFDGSGGFIYNYGSGAETLTTPSDIAIDNQFGLVFVADRGGKRVQVLQIPTDNMRF